MLFSLIGLPQSLRNLGLLGFLAVPMSIFSPSNSSYLGYSSLASFVPFLDTVLSARFLLLAIVPFHPSCEPFSCLFLRFSKNRAIQQPCVDLRCKSTRHKLSHRQILGFQRLRRSQDRHASLFVGSDGPHKLTKWSVHGRISRASSLFLSCYGV